MQHTKMEICLPATHAVRRQDMLALMASLGSCLTISPTLCGQVACHTPILMVMVEKLQNPHSA